MFKRLRESLFSKTVITVLLILFVASAFFFWGWYVKQYNKLWGYYYVYKGDKFYHSGKLQKAIDNYNLGLKYYPEHSKARCNLGNIFVIYEDYLSAIENYETALKYSPNFIICRMNLGIVQAEKLANYDAAIINYEKIIKSHPRIWWIPFIFNNKRSTKINKGIAYYNMGLAYRGKSFAVAHDNVLATKYLQSSKESYQKALKILKRDFDTQYNLALTDHLLKNYDEAGLNYCKAINLKPMQFEPHYNLALLLRTLGYYQESLEELEKAGLLIDSGGADPVKIKYIYDVLNDVNMRIIETRRGDFYYEIADAKDQTTDLNDAQEIIYANGKVKTDTGDSEAQILKTMRRCSSKVLFK